MKLNIGCGNKKIAGYTGVDAVARAAAEVVAPAWQIPLADGSVEEILAVHVWEHFYRWECDKVIAEWRRLLQPGGRLVLELPDLWKCCRNVVDRIEGKRPDQLSMWGLYGDPREEDPFMTHRWGWTSDTLREFLSANGFDRARETRPQFHSVGADIRDMRLEARKL